MIFSHMMDRPYFSHPIDHVGERMNTHPGYLYKVVDQLVLPQSKSEADMEDTYWFITAFIYTYLLDGGVNLKLSTNFTTRLEMLRVFFTAKNCLQIHQDSR